MKDSEARREQIKTKEDINMIKGTTAEQKIKDAIEKLREASRLIEDIKIEELQREQKELSDGERTILDETNFDIIESAMVLRELLSEGIHG